MAKISKLKRGEDKTERYNPNNPKGHKINTITAFEDFKRHFLTLNNTNIVLSGSYGSGKSYFLNDFTIDADISNKYHFVTLYPVNYVVSNNEDIFDLIKVDIIRSLCVDNLLDVSKSGDKIFKILAVKEYIKRRPIQILKYVSSAFSSVSISASLTEGLANSYLSILNDFAKFEDKLNKQYKSDGEKLEGFVSDFMQSKASYLENNIITQMIVTQLNENKKTEGKENVLVIEDLDRLDPEHIFRLFNILSAHQIGEKTNKFGFDKIIVVCDLNNIEKIYKHFYGNNTDFTGYISKFYSYSPFHFDIKRSIIANLNGILNINLHPAPINVLADLILFFLKANKVSLRTILQTNYLTQDNYADLICYTLPTNIYENVKKNLPYLKTPDIKFNKTDLHILGVLKGLSCLFGGYDNLDNVLNEYSTHVSGVSPEIYVDIYTMFAVHNYFSQSFEDKNYLFYHLNTARNQFILPPKASFNSEKFFVNTKWKENSNYYGTESFFSGLAINPESLGEKTRNLTMDYLSKELRRALLFYKNKGYLKSV